MPPPRRDSSDVAALVGSAIAELTDVAMVLDGGGVLLAVNDALMRRSGLSQDELIGRRLVDVIASNDREATQRSITRAFAGAVDEFTVVRGGDGRPGMVLHVTFYPILDGGDVVAVWGISRDITDSEQERARLAEMEERLSVTLNAISDGIMFLDRDWRFTYVNSTASELVGRSDAELVGKSAWDVFPDGVDGPYWHAYHRALDTGERQHVREFFEPLGGWYDVTAYPTESGLALYVRDVTDEELTRQHAEDTQRRLADQARLLDASYDAMIVRSLDHTIQYWNRAASDLYGWSADEAVGRSVTELLYDDTTAFLEANEALSRDGYWSGDLQQRTRDGDSLIVQTRWQLVLDDRGEPSAIFAVNHDITQERAATEARLRAQRMESLGTLAGGIAHDLNNVLTPILMSIQLLSQRERDETEKQILTGVEDAVKRGADMIRQVLSFARGVEGRRIRVSLEGLVEDLTQFARDALPKNITIAVTREGPAGDTMGDPTQLLQVLINLVTNAKDAMPTGGELRINARVISVDDQLGSASHLAAPGDYVSIEIEDDGHGMPAEVVSKVFEPFFTTKDPGRGTGLGLATSLAIVRSHGGFVNVRSEEGVGTCFQVALPLAREDEPASGPHSPAPAAMPRGQHEVILVVDDEPMIRKVTAQTLTAHGYRVITASQGAEALALIDSAEHPVDLVLTDMMMPVMDGAELSAFLEEHHPELPIIAMSGLNSHDSGTREAGMGITRFLPKPFTTSLLLTAVSDTLQGVPIQEGETP